MRLCAVVLLGVVLASPTARADDENAARDAFREGTRLYELGDYREALARFKLAYVKLDAPALIYNMAQCHRLLGEREPALRFYRLYLEKVPNEKDRATIDGYIAALEAPGPAPPVVAPPPVIAPQPAAPLTVEKRPIYRRWWLWTAVAAVVVAVGVTLAIVAARPRVRFDPTQPDLTLNGTAYLVRF